MSRRGPKSKFVKDLTKEQGKDFFDRNKLNNDSLKEKKFSEKDSIKFSLSQAENDCETFKTPSTKRLCREGARKEAKKLREKL